MKGHLVERAEYAHKRKHLTASSLDFAPWLPWWCSHPGRRSLIANLNEYDGSVRAIAHVANAIVVSVAYRLAPEFTLPAAHEDSFAAYQWVMQNAASMNGDPGRIAVAGESAGAGGNLATATAMMAPDRRIARRAETPN
jgi:acetyl esterase